MKVTAIDLVDKLLQQQHEAQKWAAQYFGTLEDGHFVAIAISDEECVLAPYPEFGAFIYRGQNQYYEPCKSSLYRASPNKIDRLVAEIRLSEFRLLVLDHPAVVDFSNWSVMGQRIRIDYESLAQHYGLKTQLVDFTSNPLVAAFFACCEYDSSLQRYRPVIRAGKEGVIYSYLEAAGASDPAGPEEPHSSIVGLQPLPRPAEQYAWCYRLPKRASLNSLRYITSSIFIHDPRVSTRIFEHFEGGAKLFPSDPVSEKARVICSTKKLSRSAFRLAIAKYGHRIKEGSVLNALNRKGVAIVDDREIVFTGAEKAEIVKDWRERRDDLLSRIHWRRACYPG